jgi:bile acid:Na+ symporter, BASS family
MNMKDLVPLLAQVGIVLIVMSYGLETHPRDLWAALQNKRLMVRALIAVNLVVPLAAVVLCSLFPIDPNVRIGIVLMAVSPLAPLVTFKIHLGGERTSALLGPYVALLVVAVVLVPLTIALLSALFPPSASVSVAALAKLVALSVLLPIGAGLAINAWFPRFAHVAAKIAVVAGFGIVGLLAVVILYAEGRSLLALLGDGTLLVIMGTIAAGLLAGHLLGRPDPRESSGLAIAAAMRHPGIALLIAHQNFSDPRIKLVIVLFLLTGAVMSTLYQLWMRNKSAHAAAAAVKVGT